MVRQTGCDGVVVGRGCLGRPWLFTDLAAAFAGTSARVQPTLGEVTATMRRHTEYLVDFYGDEFKACRDIRKHIAWYLKGFPAGSTMRNQLALVDSLDALDRLIATMDADAPWPGDAAEGQRGRAGIAASTSRCPRAGSTPASSTTPPASPSPRQSCRSQAAEPGTARTPRPTAAHAPSRSGRTGSARPAHPRVLSGPSRLPDQSGQDAAPWATALQQLAVEGRQVAGVAAGDEVAVDDDLLVDPLGARVAQVGLQAGPRRELAAPPRPPRQGPGGVADRGDDLAGGTKSRTKATASSSIRRASGLATPPGSTRAS